MIGSLPVDKLAPLDYRYALDGALALLGSDEPILVGCEQPELVAETTQRLSVPGPNPAVLWIEPQRIGWQTVLHELATGLAPATPLVVIASQPLARLLPERRTWAGDPLGITLGGIGSLRRSLAALGLYVEAQYGVHGLMAITYNKAGQLLARVGRPDLGDRLEFAARLHYRVSGSGATLATVALILARKGSR